MNKQYLSRRWHWVDALVCLLKFAPLPATRCAEPITPVLQVQAGKLTGLMLDRAIQGVYNKPPAGK